MRLLFRRFLGLSLSEPVPDHSTLWRFREQLGTSGLASTRLHRRRTRRHGLDCSSPPQAMKRRASVTSNETPSCPSDIRPRSVDIVLDEAFTGTQ
jgi:IS5 family transposase